MDGLAERLATARKAAGLTQHALAEATDIRGGTISRYERRELVPGVEHLAKLASTLGASLDWLVTGEGEGPKPSPHAAADAAE